MLVSEALFDANVTNAYGGRVEKIASRSVIGLDRLATSQHEQFDLIYVDASHDRDDVMTEFDLVVAIAQGRWRTDLG